MDLAELRSQGLLELLDVELARALSRVGGSDGHPDVALAIALTTRNVRRGHTCFPLQTKATALWAREPVPEATLPEASPWATQLRASALTHDGPLVLDERDRLYLRRYWQLEQDIADNLASRSANPRPLPDDTAWLESTLDRLFPEGSDSPQRRAAENALANRVSLLCGGPGTGKTTTVAAIVAMIAERDLRETGTPPKVVLLAPTGKAAARLGEAVLGAKGRINADDDVLACIPNEASTVHRALGMRREGMRFRRSAELPLEADVIVLDEASMIDLALMRQLLDATHPDATLLMVGDPDQLTSVEAGSVLRDLVDASDETWWRDRVTRLTKTWRYDETQPLGRLVRAIREGEADAVLDVLGDEAADDVVWEPLDRLPAELDRAAGLWAEVLATTDAARHFELRRRFVTLTPFRRGPIGTAKLGTSIEERLRAQGRESGVTPIIIEQNSQELRVFNGDFAMLVTGETPTAIVESDSEEPRQIAEARLPRYADAFALSVHKSQGSEFEEVMIVLPEEDAPLLTRELLYTAVSRAKKRVRIVGPKEVVEAALERRARRDSGLVDAIGKRAPR
jgi:exodeoxyribonuclease V alpha subunit